MVELRRTYRFCASHRLHRPEWSEAENLRVFGPAAHPSGHGHNFRLTIVIRGALDPVTERVADLDALDRVVEAAVVEPFDHKNLNADVPSLAGRVPTAEVLATEIWRRLAGRLPSGELIEVSLQQDEFLTAVHRG